MPRVSEERLEATRQQILAGARRAFATYGYEGATVRVLELETRLSRGAIFHHFPDKEALFLALAEEDAAAMVERVREHGLVQVMRDLSGEDPDWLGVQVEIAQRLRTEPGFREQWQARHLDAVARAARQRLLQGRRAGAVRDDVPVSTLVTYLLLVHDGLVAHVAAGLPTGRLDGVLDLVEESVRAQRSTAARAPSAGPGATRSTANERGTRDSTRAGGGHE
jgi:AcrR family transcriptional regulator